MVLTSKRFEFGKNWQNFLANIDDKRIAESEKSLKTMLGIDDLKEKSFLDIGSGSGLFSLAARRLGARVHSFDYDPQSVACAYELKRLYFPNDHNWTMEVGDVLDVDYVKSLGEFDVVYAWGVLHHTGAMWQAVENAQIPVTKNGRLFVAIYNHRAVWTALDKQIKRAFVNSPLIGKWLIAGTFIVIQITKGLIKDLALFRNPVKRYREYENKRGMSRWHDWIDWVGGYPFETAKPDQISNFYRQKGFVLEQEKIGAGKGNNQFVFRKSSI